MNSGSLEQQHQQEHSPPRSAVGVRTYVVGEDAGRLASAASYLGLEQHNVERRPLQPVRDAVSRLFHDTTLTAARMHSVGAIGRDERVDASGTLHFVSVRRRRMKHIMKTYGSLQNLFETGKQAAALEVAGIGEEIGEEEEEEEFVEDVVEGRLFGTTLRCFVSENAIVHMRVSN